MTMLRMSSGAIVWALHFTVIYGFTALACARGFGASAAWVVGVATLLAAAAAGLLILWNWKGEFTRWMTAAVAGAALVAILWEGMTAFVVPNACV
jgi:hypothetical protein